MEPLSCSSQHRCDYQNEEGRLCAASFKRAWNLKRHIQEQHGSQPGDSHYSPGGESDRSPLPSTVRGPRSHDDHRPPPASRSWNGGPRTSLPPPAAAGVLRDPTDGTVPRMSIGAMISPGTMDHSSTAHPQAINNGPGSDSDTPAASTSLKRPAPITRPGSTTDLSEGDLSEGDGSSRPDIPPKRRHHRISLNSRGAQSARAPPVPIYDVKQSKKYGEQLRALSWLSCDAKTTFDEMYRVLLSQWGVQPTHQGTCVLIPEEWRLADPLELELEVADTFPKIDLPRAAFTYQDHGVSIGRALTWFSRWPRAGTELDNFLGCGPFQPMDASHLCHHDHCLIHLVYEAAHINLDRCRCRRRAVFLRQEGRPISEHCDQHSPPCLLQVRTACPVEDRWLIGEAACVAHRPGDVLDSICRLTASARPATVTEPASATEVWRPHDDAGTR